MWIPGPAKLVIKGADGEGVDLSNIKSETKAQKREYEVIKIQTKCRNTHQRHLYVPKCDCVEVYACKQTRSSDEPETRMLTCKECGNG